MADIRCPMCGKSNPDHLEICQFCEARLTPLAPPKSSEGATPQKNDSADLPEWLSLDWDANQDSEESPSSEDESDAQEWLDRIRVDSETEETDAQTGFGDDQPMVGGPVSESASPSEDGAEWLNRIRSLHQSDQETQAGDFDRQAEPVDPSGSSPTQEDDLDLDRTAFDFLSSLADDEPGEGESEQNAAISQVEDEDIPDWLSTLGTESSDEDISSSEASLAADSNVPDWLSDIGIDHVEADATAATLTEGENIPVWLSEMGTAQGADDTAEPISPTPEADMPDWLSSLGDAGDTAEDDAPGEKLVPEIAGDGPEQLEDLGDWLSDIDEVEGSASEPTPEAEELETVEDMPGWLKNLGSVVTGSVEEASIPEADSQVALPFVQVDAGDDLLDVEGLPEWLTPDSAAAGSVEGSPDSDLTPTELPGWLAAMRPVEGEKSGGVLEDGTIESAGPLAGLRNVLPAEPEIIHFKKPPVYSAKLRVSDNQQSQADIFQELLASEGKATTIPDIPLVSTQRALRWLIAFILMTAIGLMVIRGSQNVPLPSSAAIPDSTYAASRIVSAIPDQAPVLLAFDYEPGTSGEMQAAAAALVDHLMLKGARLTLVSTLPTGPAVGEYFIQNVQAQHNYTSGKQYVNLGYIPGGAAGLASFVQMPKWVFKLSYDGMEPWETQPLQNIERISDFEVVVIIADDPQVARTWIEQAQPKLGKTPLLMVVSAQAEPLVRPYFGNNQNTQVQGIISGLTGGAAYEVTVGKTNLARTYWDAFSIGLIIAVAAVLIGGGANVIRLLLTQNKRKDQGEAR